MKTDIQSRTDIEQLVRAFYERALADASIGFLFTEVAQIDLDTHLPHLCDFWENILLKPNGYKRNVLKKHLDLNQLSALKPEHFQQWLLLFEQTVDELFEGEKAQSAKNKAQSIALVIQTKLYKQSW